MRMRSYVCLLLLLASLAACADGENGAGSQTPVPTQASDDSRPIPLPEGATTGARVRSRGYLVVGVRYDLVPFGFITEEGEVAGFDVDLGRELARRWLGDGEAVQFRQVRSDTALSSLQAGEVDLIAAAQTHTQEGEAGADFGLPTFLDGQALLVRTADVPAIGGPADLEGRPVGVVAWEGTETALAQVVPFTPTVKTYSRFDQAVDALSIGDVDAVADERHRLFWGQRLSPETAIVGQYTSAPIALAFPEDDPFFADLVRLTWQEMVVDGTYGELYTRWFAGESAPPVELWPGSEVPSLADAPVTADVPDTIGAIESRGRLVVALATGRPPFAYADANGVSVGYEVSLMRLMAERWLGDGQAVDFVPTSLDEGREMVRSGQADVLIGGLTHTRAAELALDFSTTTYLSGEGLLIQAGTVITDVTSLRGQRVAVIEGSGSREVLQNGAREAGISLLIVSQPSLEVATTLLAEGQVLAVAGDRVDLLGLAYANPNLDVYAYRFTQVPLALGLPPGDSAFRDLVNLTLQSMKANGQFDGLYATWFNDAPPRRIVWPGLPYRRLELEPAVVEGGG